MKATKIIKNQGKFLFGLEECARRIGNPNKMRGIDDNRDNLENYFLKQKYARAELQK